MLKADLLNVSWWAAWCLNNPYETDVMVRDCVPENLHCAYRWPWNIAIVASRLLKVVSTGTINHIQGVLWTDESKCCLDFNDGRRCVWSKKNERFRHRGRQTRDLKPVYEHDLFCGVSDLVWAGISYDGSTDLYVIRNGSLTGVRYMNEIIAPIVRP